MFWPTSYIFLWKLCIWEQIHGNHWELQIDLNWFILFQIRNYIAGGVGAKKDHSSSFNHIEYLVVVVQGDQTWTNEASQKCLRFYHIKSPWLTVQLLDFPQLLKNKKVTFSWRPWEDKGTSSCFVVRTKPRRRECLLFPGAALHSCTSNPLWKITDISYCQYNHPRQILHTFTLCCAGCFKFGKFGSRSFLFISCLNFRQFMLQSDWMWYHTSLKTRRHST